MKKQIIRLAVFGIVLGTTFNVSAHRSWILPAATVLSGDDAWVTFDAAASNDIFHPDHRPLGLDGVMAMGPDGEMVTLKNKYTGQYRSNFDLHLTKQGTYKIYTANSGLSASWETEDGDRGRYPGRGQQYSAEGFAAAVPDNAVNLDISQRSQRRETFVTVGIPSDTVFEPENKGFEMVPVTHPNDLYSGETAEFRFLIDGEPAAGAQIEVLAGGMRYRNSQDEIMLTTDDDGIAEITWPHAGMYWMEASYSDSVAVGEATSRNGTYIATFEVLPL